MTTIDFSKYGHLVLCVESSKNKTFKVVELTGQHPNIISNIIACDIPANLEIDYSRYIDEHNTKLYKY